MTDLLKITAFLILGFAIPFVMTSLVKGAYVEPEKEQETTAYMDTGRSVCVYENGRYRLMDVEEYVLYSLAGQVDMNYDDEMLKVMAVMYRTSIYYQMRKQSTASGYTGNVAGEKLSASEKLIDEKDLEEIRFSEAELRQKFGSDYDLNMEKIKKAICETKGQVIEHNNEYIMPIYHEVSGGATCSANEYYGQDLPYLTTVDSPQDIEAVDYERSYTYSETRLMKTFAKNIDKREENSVDNTDAEKSVDNTSTENGDISYVQITEQTSSGYVLKVNVYGNQITGEEFARTLNLGTTNFAIESCTEGYKIICHGKGNGIGLSLFGANYMAKKGSSYVEILGYYYKGARVEKCSK